MDKFNSLWTKISKYSNCKTSLIKPALFNLISEGIQKQYKLLLMLVPSNKNMPFIISTGSCALDLEYNLVNKAETQRQNVSNMLKKNVNMKIRTNLTKEA